MGEARCLRFPCSFHQTAGRLLGKGAHALGVPARVPSGGGRQSKESSCLSQFAPRSFSSFLPLSFS